MSLGTIIKKFRDLRGITQKALGDRTHLDDVRIRQYELDIRTPKENILEDISSSLHINKDYLKEPNYPYSEEDLIRFLFKLDDTIEVNIRPITVTDDSDMTINGIYFGSEAILRINLILEEWKKMKEKYVNGEITLEALEDFKANYPDSIKKGYEIFEEGKKKRYKNEIRMKTTPNL